MPDIREVKVNGKYSIILPEHRAARPEWYTEGGWEKKRIDSLISTLDATDTLFYVGAEEGDIAALCQKNTLCNMVLFEPNSRVFSNIRLIWEANGLETPYIFTGFASDKTTVEPFIQKAFPISAYGEVITDHGFKELCDPGTIPQVKIDDLEPIVVPTAITMDCEGSEPSILRGAEQVLRKYHPKLWISWHPEFTFRIYNSYIAETRKWLIDMGYKETVIDYPLHEAHFFYTN